METIAYTIEQARRDYPQRLRYAQVIELGHRFGCTRKTMRTLMEGEKPALPGIVFTGTTRAYYDREKALTVLGI